MPLVGIGAAAAEGLSLHPAGDTAAFATAGASATAHD